MTLLESRLQAVLGEICTVNLPTSYLTERVTLAEVLAEFDFQACPPDFWDDWERLLSKRVYGDELWRFAPPPGAIRLWGIALVRDGVVVSTLVEAVD